MSIEIIAGLVVIIGYPLAVVFESKHTISRKIMSIISGEMVFIFGCNLLSLNFSWTLQAICLVVGCVGNVYLNIKKNRNKKAFPNVNAEQKFIQISYESAPSEKPLT